MDVKKITGLKKSQREYDECYTIWKECFGDSDQYMEYYFTEKLRDNTIYLLEEDGQVVSMLHLNPYEMMVEGTKQTANYIVGVATKEAYRKRGYMGQLLKAAMKDMYEEGQLFTYLMPAAYAIYAPYDFRYVYEQQRVTTKIEIEEHGLLQAAQLQSTGVTSWGQLTKEEKENASLFAERMLQQQFDVYPCHSIAYYDRMAVEMAAADGDLIVVTENDQIIGILSYMTEKGEAGLEVAVVESLLDSKDTELLFSQLKAQFSLKEITVHLYESEFVEKELLGEVFTAATEETKPIIMARALDAKKLLETMRAKKETTVCIQLKDGFLAENNKTYEVHFDAHSSQVAEATKEPELIMEMPEFVQWVFKNKRCFINDIV